MSAVTPTKNSAAANLRRARGYLDEPVDFRANLLTGWALLPDVELSSVRVSLNGAPAGSAAVELRPEVAGAYPRIPHAGRSGFRVALRPGQLRPAGVNRASVLGCRGRRPVARFDTLFFPAGCVPAVPTPPLTLVGRVQDERDAKLYRGLGYRYYLQFREAVACHRAPGTVRRLLDWGCGSGRVAAYFLAEPNGPQVFGCDIDPEAVAWCRENLRPGEFTAVAPAPPLPYPDGAFDVVVSLAVMAAFGPEAYALWLPELRRVLAPGGLFLGSVQGAFTASFEYPAAALRHLLRDGIFDGGRGPEGGQWRGFFLTREYVEREWSRYFEVLEHLEGEINSDEDLVVARRTA
jgi:SAM-dependent methyltransferase